MIRFIAVLIFVVAITGVSLAHDPNDRSVSGNLLTSNARPEIQIRVDDDLEFLGVIKHPLKGIAKYERYIFARQLEGEIKAMFIAQFEEALPDSDLIYRWTIRNPVNLGGEDYHHNSWYYDQSAAVAEGPENEAAMTVAFLNTEGFEVADHWMMSRYARITDMERKSELILFYFEPLSPEEFASFGDDDKPTELWHEASEALIRRGEAAFHVIQD